MFVDARIGGLFHYGFLRYGGSRHKPHRRGVPAREPAFRRFSPYDGFSLVSVAFDTRCCMDEPMGTETDCLARLRLYVCRIGFAVCCGRGMFARHLFRRLRSAGCRQYHRAGGGQSVVGDHCAERTHDRLSDCRTDFPECLVVARRTARCTFCRMDRFMAGLVVALCAVDRGRRHLVAGGRCPRA